LDDYVTLMPGDKKTWLISGNGLKEGGNWAQTLINDNPPANQPESLAYYRFMNVNPNFEPQGLSLMVGDPLHGMALATAVHYKSASVYTGIPVAKDTSVTFFVVDPSSGAVLSRLAGVGLSAGSYHTITWGGQFDSSRIPDPTTGNLTLNDTVRIRILDDDPGTDLTLTPPLTFRFNIINALIPANSIPKAGLVDYTQPNNINKNGGLNIIINNNTSYDYQGLGAFSLAPGAIPGKTIGTSDVNAWDTIPSVVPTTTVLIDKILIDMVRPVGTSPSNADSTIFRFYAGNGHPFNSDALYAIVVFDSTKLNGPKALDLNAPFDSAYATTTVPIPDVPIKGSARIVLGYMPCYPGPGVPKQSNFPAKLYVNTGSGDQQDLNDYSTGRLLKSATNGLGTKFKTFDSSLVVTAGQQVTLKAVISTDQPYIFTFTPEDGAIYEAFLVGQRGRKDDPAYSPRFMVIRINPIFP
jgi:hypothetical protein